MDIPSGGNRPALSAEAVETGHHLANARRPASDLLPVRSGVLQPILRCVTCGLHEPRLDTVHAVAALQFAAGKVGDVKRIGSPLPVIGNMGGMDHQSAFEQRTGFPTTKELSRQTSGSVQGASQDRQPWRGKPNP